jgi:hypothetical protein
MVTHLVLPLHEAATDHAVAESAVEPLHAAVVGPAATSAASTETSCLCVQVLSRWWRAPSSGSRMVGGGGAWGVEATRALGLEILLCVGRERVRPEILRARIRDAHI